MVGSSMGFAENKLFNKTQTIDCPREQCVGKADIFNFISFQLEKPWILYARTTN